MTTFIIQFYSVWYVCVGHCFKVQFSPVIIAEVNKNQTKYMLFFMTWMIREIDFRVSGKMVGFNVSGNPQ